MTEREWRRIAARGKWCARIAGFCAPGFIVSLLGSILVDTSPNSTTAHWCYFAVALAGIFLASVFIAVWTAPSAQELNRAYMAEVEWKRLEKIEQERWHAARGEALREIIHDTGFGYGDQLWRQLDAMRKER